MQKAIAIRISSNESPGIYKVDGEVAHLHSSSEDADTQGSPQRLAIVALEPLYDQTNVERFP